MREHRRRSRGDVAPTGGDLAALVHRLAVLLGAGVSPVAAWRHAATGPLAPLGEAIAAAGPNAVPSAIAEQARRLGAGGGETFTRRRIGRLRRSGEREAQTAVVRGLEGLAATWEVATASGSPLASALRSYAAAMRGFATADRQSTVALSGPRATARLVIAMPAIGVVFGALLGHDTVAVLLGSPLGWACLVIGVVLLLSGWAWNAALLRRATAGDRVPGLLPELVAVAMAGGTSIERARSIVESAVTHFGIHADWRAVDESLAISTAAGAPVSELLRSEAEEARRAAIAEAGERAERLGVSLMVPLGVCVLPAFIAVGVVPLIVSIVGSAVAWV